MRFVVVVPCRWRQSCFVAFIASMRLAAFLRVIPVRTRSWNTSVGLRHPDIVNMALFMLTSTLTCGVLLQTVTRIQAADKTRAWVEFRNVIAQSPHVVPVRHALMTRLPHSICNLGRNFFIGCLKFSVRSKCTPMYFVAFWNTVACQRTRSAPDSLLNRLTGKTFPAYERLTATTSATNLQFWLTYMQLNAMFSKMIGWTLFNGGVQQWIKLISTVHPCTRYPPQKSPTTALYSCRMPHKAMWVQETLTCV